ncbi:MAG: alpha/beta hydrolase [Gammaproteobacteria bacterium]|nr:alpha/beta hydrolase [Gammaproteobacteria bacterium]
MEIVFIPGLICTNQIWGELNNLRNYYQCHDADIYHFDRIEKTSDYIIKNLPNREITVIGISMGGYIAIDMALKDRKKIKNLILINTTSNSVNLSTINDRMKGIELAKKGMLDEVVEMYKGACYFQPKNEWIMLEKEMAQQVGPDAYINQQLSIINRTNYSEVIKNIQAKTLIISGKNDQIIPYHDSIHMFENIPQSSLILLNKCGHLATLEKGNFIFNIINEFLKEKR